MDRWILLDLRCDDSGCPPHPHTIVAHKILELIELRNAAEEAALMGEYEANLLKRAQEVCAVGSPECAKAIDAAQRAQKTRVKKIVKLVISSAGLPGTFLGGPLPTSKVDTGVAGLTEPFMMQFQTLMNRDIEIQRKAKANQPETPQPRAPDYRPCLKNRDGTCIP
jgi:hypothetical protein